MSGKQKKRLLYKRFIRLHGSLFLCVKLILIFGVRKECVVITKDGDLTEDCIACG